MVIGVSGYTTEGYRARGRTTEGRGGPRVRGTIQHLVNPGRVLPPRVGHPDYRCASKRGVAMDDSAGAVAEPVRVVEQAGQTTECDGCTSCVAPSLDLASTKHGGRAKSGELSLRLGWAVHDPERARDVTSTIRAWHSSRRWQSNWAAPLPAAYCNFCLRN